MKIKELQTAEFMGLSGVRKYDLSSKISAFCSHNAAGKTSVLSALRYALTGVEPSGDTVMNGQPKAAVEIEFQNGDRISRMRYSAKGKAQKFYVNRKLTTLAELNSVLVAQSGNKQISGAKVIASSELIRNLSSQKFGELLIQYLPELMTKDDVISRITGLSDEEKKYILDALPEGDFGVDELDRLYATFVENRKAAKRKITEEKAVLSTYDSVEEPKETAEELDEMLKDLSARRDAAIAFEAKKREYERLKKQAEEHLTIIRNLDKKIAEITVIEHADDERQAAAVLLDAYRTTVTSAYSAMQTALTDGRALRKAIDTIGQPTCPLSEKLVCTTDKSKVLGDLQNSLDACKKSYEEQKAAWERAKSKAKEAEAKLTKIAADEAQAKMAEDLRAQREQLEKAMPKVPEDPGKGEDPAVLDKELIEVRKKIQFLKDFERVKKIRSQLEDNEKILTKYESLADTFSPKGEVKRAVTKYYLDEFAAPCNRKAEKIFHGMNIRFVPENGVTVLVDTKGDGTYISFESLSEGEKVCVTFLIMAMLSDISGFRVLIMDELSVLDKNALAGLIDVLKENEDEYDVAVIACVDHDDSVAVLKEKGVNIIKC